MSIPAVTWGEFLINSRKKEGTQKGVHLQELDNGKFLAAWEHEVTNDLGVTTTEIWVQRFYSGAVAEGEPVRIDTTAGINSAPTMTVLADGKLVYTWEHQTTENDVTTYSIRARVFNADGTPFDTNGAGPGGTSDFEVVAGSATPVSSPIIEALSGGGFVVSYNSEAGDGAGNPGVQAKVFNANGQAVGGGAVNAETDGAQNAYALIGLSANSFAALYSGEPTAAGSTTLKASICTTAGGFSHADTEFDLPISFKNGTKPAATLLSDGNILIVWTEVSIDGEGDDVKAQIFSKNLFGAITEAFTVNQGTAGNQGMPGVTALKGGGFAITYIDTNITGTHQVRVAVFNAANTRLDDRFISAAFDEGQRAAPKVIELLDGRLIAAWDEDIDGRADDSVGIRGQVIDARFQGINLPGTADNDQFVGTEFNDILSGGTAGSDDLNGREGNDVLNGGIGDDRLHGGSGVDQMSGGTGNDMYYVDNAGDIVSEAGGNGTDTVYTSISYTISADIENLIAEGNGAINLTGNAGNNTITGNTANNVIDGGAGADRMDGGLGNDTYYVDNAGDVVLDSGGDADMIYTSISYTLTGGIENMVATGAAAISLTGDALNNTLTGNAGANTIDGGFGNDIIDGAGGNDDVRGADGNDNITGGDGNDKLDGGFGIDVLNGGAGNDTVNGGDGNDILNGGAGKDVFVFNTQPVKGTNRDQIVDFDVKFDKIHLENAVLKKLKKTGKMKGDFFKVGAKASDKNDYVLYNKKKGLLSYDADGSGKQKAVEFATTKKNLALTPDHFFII